MGNRTQFHGKLLNFWNLVKICFRDRGVDLKLDAGLFCKSDAVQCAFISAVNSPEAVVAFFCRTVQTDADSSDAGIRHLSGRGFRDQGSVGGHHHAESLVCSVACNFKYVGPKQGLSACQDDDGSPGFGNLIQQTERRGGIQFSGIWSHCCGCTAVDTGKVAVAGDFISNQAERGFFFLFVRMW